MVTAGSSQTERDWELQGAAASGAFCWMHPSHSSPDSLGPAPNFERLCLANTLFQTIQMSTGQNHRHEFVSRYVAKEQTVYDQQQDLGA